MEEHRGTLVRILSGFYTVVDDKHREYTLRCKKKMRRERLSPMVGDKILFTPGDREELGWVEEVLPRKTVCLRPPAANVEQLILVEAAVPEPDLLLADRQIARAESQGIEVAIAVNKCDLNTSLAERLRKEYAPAGIPVFPVSARTGAGLDSLTEIMRGKLCCLTGQSGVGKSSLLNRILGLQLETGDVSRKIARGKNTTRLVELIEKDGLRIMDSAGFSLMEPQKNLEPEKLKSFYPEFRVLEGKCRFRECLHDREPGCAVATAANEGTVVHPARLERYRILLAETREAWNERYN